MTVVVLVPADLEPAKLLGTSVYGAQVIAVRGSYDDANRLSSEMADERGWGFVNVNLRPFYAEGSKTVGYEIAEQLGLAAARARGGADGGRLAAAQASPGPAGAGRAGPGAGRGPAGCTAPSLPAARPIARMIREGRDEPVLVKEPRTIARSLAIGNPGDAAYARAAILASGGFAAAPDDEEIAGGVRLLARDRGHFRRDRRAAWWWRRPGSWCARGASALATGRWCCA